MFSWPPPLNTKLSAMKAVNEDGGSTVLHPERKHRSAERQLYHLSCRNEPRCIFPPWSQNPGMPRTSLPDAATQARCDVTQQRRHIVLTGRRIGGNAPKPSLLSLGDGRHHEWPQCCCLQVIVSMKIISRRGFEQALVEDARRISSLIDEMHGDPSATKYPRSLICLIASSLNFSVKLLCP